MLDTSITYSVLWHLVFSALFIFSISSGIIGFYSKQKTFIYYSLYSFFLLLYIALKLPYKLSFISDLYESKWSIINWYLQSIYYTFYFLFFLYFLNINKHFPTTHTYFRIGLGIIFTISCCFFLASLSLSNVQLYEGFYFYSFIPIVTLMAIFAIYKATKTEGKLKYFFISGSIVYLLSAFTSLFISLLIKNNYSSTLLEELAKFGGLFYFFIGILIENFLFTLGLAYKVKEINQKLILGFLENEKLKNNLNQQLENELKKKEKEVKKLIKKAQEKKLLQLKTEYEVKISKLQLTTLHSQMNPHFLFNALNSLKVFLIDNKTNEAITYLNTFSKLIRKILETSHAEVVSLAEEIEIIKLYTHIEKTRMDVDLTIIISNKDNINLETIKLPSLVLQPFVENAIWHGLSQKPGKKKVELKIFKHKNQQPILHIEDNGIGRNLSKKENSIGVTKNKSLGIQITKERLKHYNTKEKVHYHFDIVDLKDSNGNPSGTRVVFHF